MLKKSSNIILIAVFIILLLLLQYQLWLSKNSVGHILQLDKQIIKQAQINHDIQQHNQVLIYDIRDLQMSQQSVVGVARDDLGMIKKGETYYQVVH